MFGNLVDISLGSADQKIQNVSISSNGPGRVSTNEHFHPALVKLYNMPKGDGEDKISARETKKVTESPSNIALATMAASNVIFNLSRSPLPQSPAAHSRSPSLKASRVCFTSASELTTSRNAAEKSIDYSSSRRAYAGKDWSTKAKPTVEEDAEDGKQLFEQITGAASEYAKETMENVKGASEAVAGTAKEYTDDAKEKTNEAAETIAAKAEEATNKVTPPETTQSAESETVKETPKNT